MAKTQRVGVSAPFKPARIYAREELEQRPKIDVALPLVAGEPHP